MPRNVRVHAVQDEVMLVITRNDLMITAELTVEEAREVRTELDLAIKIAALPPVPCLETLIGSLR